MNDENAEKNENADPSDNNSAVFVPSKNIVHDGFSFTKKRDIGASFHVPKNVR